MDNVECDKQILAEILNGVKQVEFQFKTLATKKPSKVTVNPPRKSSPKLVNATKQKVHKNSTGQFDDSDSDEDGKFPNRSHSYSRRNKKRMQSKKHGRRHENFCYMLNIVYGESITDDEFEFEENNDLVDRDSPFSRLILNPNNLKVWVEFMSKTGEEQDDFLKALDLEEVKRETINNGNLGPADVDSDLKLALLSYRRIDKNIREVMKKESSMDCIQKYEKSVIDAFSVASAQEHSIQDLVCKFERLILHGLCQYIDVKSKSVENGDSVIMRMALKGVKFRKPGILLSDFLKKKILL